VILKELENSMRNDLVSNLTSDFLKKCFDYNTLWNGSTDKRILLRLGINCITLNLTAYDEYNNKIFYLKLIDCNNNNLIFVYKLGYIKKNRRLLMLLETHNLICSNNHCLGSRLFASIWPGNHFKICDVYNLNWIGDRT
jgi:hypothetical protein